MTFLRIVINVDTEEHVKEIPSENLKLVVSNFLPILLEHLRSSGAVELQLELGMPLKPQAGTSQNTSRLFDEATSLCSECLNHSVVRNHSSGKALPSFHAGTLVWICHQA